MRRLLPILVIFSCQTAFSQQAITRVYIDSIISSMSRTVLKVAKKEENDFQEANDKGNKTLKGKYTTEFYISTSGVLRKVINKNFYTNSGDILTTTYYYDNGKLIKMELYRISGKGSVTPTNEYYYSDAQEIAKVERFEQTSQRTGVYRMLGVNYQKMLNGD